MDTIYWIGAGVLAAGLAAAAVAMRRPDRLEQAIDRAKEAGEIDPIVRAIDEMGRAESSTTWHKALDKLWNAYERELAARLVVKAAEHHTSDTVQFWTRKVVEVEPELAKRTFSREFIIEMLELDEDALPKPGPRPPRRGERQQSKKASKKKKK